MERRPYATNSSNWMQRRSPQPQQLRVPCITLHQPWASLLVHGIKRVEGRSWPAPLRGRLWIHAAAKIPDPATIESVQNFYRELYSLEGVSDLKFPEHYPVSVLLGSVNVVGCVKTEELADWEDLPHGVRLESLTDFAWLCEDPQKLPVPFEMRGWQGVYNLEKKIAAAAERGLRPIQGPAPVKFPLPDPLDLGSLKPGVLSAMVNKSRKGKGSENIFLPPTLSASIAGARAATAQFKKPELERLGAQSSSSFARNQELIQPSKSDQSLSTKGHHPSGL